MTDYKFNDDHIKHALEAVKKSNEETPMLKASQSDLNVIKGGCLQVSGGCISITIEKHKVCINLPLGIGKICFNIPGSIPDGSVGKACLTICTTFGIPTGVKVQIVVGGVTVINQKFGVC